MKAPFWRAVMLVALIASGAACGPTHAKTPADDPGLATPEAPARVIVPVTIDIPAAATEPSKPAARETTSTPARRPEASAQPSQASQPPAQTTTTSSEPAPILQTSANVSEAEKRVRGIVAKAQADLSHVDYRVLSSDARAQYDQAKRFLDQTEAALKVKNVVFAEQLAGKAANLAASLVRRD